MQRYDKDGEYKDFWDWLSLSVARLLDCESRVRLPSVLVYDSRGMTIR